MKIAVQHIHFGGNAHKATLRRVMEASIGANILRTDYGTAICKYLGRNALIEILIEYFSTFNKQKSNFVACIHASPQEWGISEETKQRIENFVLDKARNESVYEQMKRFFDHFN